ncbi:hypothetical protein F5883DRAFT_527319 [Diaporthe sp. PMI_573]|nr:hypothetical protein F5883DRAFT_527319 [Diaporthaceae sp. PMI_573]
MTLEMAPSPAGKAPITRVNKTIRRETLPLFYGNHKFVCEVPKPPKEFYGPRQNRYHLDSIWERLRDFDPPARHPIISNLRFLSQVTILLEVESRYFTRLGFTMSSKALVQNELAARSIRSEGMRRRDGNQEHQAKYGLAHGFL